MNENTMGRDEAVRVIEHAATVLVDDGEPIIAENLIAALTALRDGERDTRPLYTTHVPCWALPAVESALSMLDLQGYWHSDLAAFRDWLKEKSV